MKYTTHLLNKPGKEIFSALLLFQLCFFMVII